MATAGRETLERVKQLYDEVGNNGKDVLDEEWKRFGASVSRDEIASHEEVIQEFLHHVYEPIVSEPSCPHFLASYQVNQKTGRTLEDCLSEIRRLWVLGAKQLPEFSLIGAHYRSAISVRGRRSSFAVDREKLLARLQPPILDDGSWQRFNDSVRRPLFMDLWHAVFLDQYFRLFGKATTMNEWVLEILKKIDTDPETEGVLVRFRSPSGKCSRIPEPAGPWICVDFPEEFCKTLLYPQDSKVFYNAVTQAVVDALTTDCANAKSALDADIDGRPTAESMFAWFQLLRDADSRAWARLDHNRLRQSCELRCSYIAGRLMFDEKYSKLEGDLLRHFARYAKEGKGDDRFETLQRTVKVFQAMLLYCSLYGDVYLTFPFWKPSAPGCSLTFMSHAKPSDSASELTGLAGDLRELGRGLFRGVISHAKEKSGELEKVSVTLQEGGPFILWPEGEEEGVKKVWNEIYKSGPPFTREWYQFILALVMNLASAKHEGQELGFSFLLGNPYNLVHDLFIEHEFIFLDHDGSKIVALRLGHERLEIARALALIKGNYAFLQDPGLALFVSYPGAPPEITHIVRLSLEGGRQRTRRSMLATLTLHRSDLLASVSYGNGRADVIFGGRLMGSYSPSGKWRPASSYEEFWDALEDELVKKLHSPAELSILLEPVIEKVSGAPGQGALFALGPTDRVENLKAVRLTEVFDLIESRRIGHITEDLLYQLAIEDGATLIDIRDGRVWGRRQLNAIDPKEYKPKSNNPEHKTLRDLWENDKRPNGYGWSDWYKTLQWGTRHLASLAASLTLGEPGLVIVISSDGPVHVLRNGKPVQYKTKQGGFKDLVYGE